jgi:hypothetical protein
VGIAIIRFIQFKEVCIISMQLVKLYNRKPQNADPAEDPCTFLREDRESRRRKGRGTALQHRGQGCAVLRST